MTTSPSSFFSSFSSTINPYSCRVYSSYNSSCIFFCFRSSSLFSFFSSFFSSLFLQTNLTLFLSFLSIFIFCSQSTSFIFFSRSFFLLNLPSAESSSPLAFPLVLCQSAIASDVALARSLINRSS